MGKLFLEGHRPLCRRSHPLLDSGDHLPARDGFCLLWRKLRRANRPGTVAGAGLGAATLYRRALHRTARTAVSGLGVCGVLRIVYGVGCRGHSADQGIRTARRDRVHDGGESGGFIYFVCPAASQSTTQRERDWWRKGLMRVLLSGYACSPGFGSEQGVGWNRALQLARFHEVWVITRQKNRAPIEAATARAPMPNVHFLYHYLPRWARFWKKKRRGITLLLLPLAAYGLLQGPQTAPRSRSGPDPSCDLCELLDAESLSGAPAGKVRCWDR